jgi:hypothetical protein
MATEENDELMVCFTAEEDGNVTVRFNNSAPKTTVSVEIEKDNYDPANQVD